MGLESRLYETLDETLDCMCNFCRFSVKVRWTIIKCLKEKF